MRLVLVVTLGALLLLGGSLVLTLLDPSRRIWPPPGRSSWQYRFTWTLTLVATVGILALGILDWNSFVLAHRARIPLGLLLAVGGLAFALWGMRSLSVHATLGLEGPLVESGAYRYSRNPQYVGDIALLVGWALLSNSLVTGLACVLGASWFALAPWTEEPWLRERFGAAYEAYCRRVPRFLGRRRAPRSRTA